MFHLHHLLIICILGFIFTPLVGSEIHRAVRKNGGKNPPYPAGEIPGTGCTESRSPGCYGDDGVDNSGGEEDNYLEAWVCSIVASLVVGMAGIFPLLLPIEAGPDLQTGPGAARFKCLLSFAVGGLLGDVFLHLLPEAWGRMPQDDHFAHMKVGLWVLTGILTFLMLEKMFSDEETEEEPCAEHIQTRKSGQQLDTTNISSSTSHKTTNSKHFTNGFADHNGISNDTVQRNGDVKTNNNAKMNGLISTKETNKLNLKNGRQRKKRCENGNDDGTMMTTLSDVQIKATEVPRIKVTGYLNLLANFIDNFTHGLAVAGSFLVSFKVGVLTTIAIMLHEIPHEIGDFAILLQSGFDRWKAAKAQMYTATGGICGAMLALMSESAEKAGDSSAWILPFTAGGFINIALVTVVPDLLKETNPRESVKQVLCLLSGIGIMAAVNLIVE